MSGTQSLLSLRTVSNSLAEQIWRELKVSAANQAQRGVAPLEQDCLKAIEAIVTRITGFPGFLPRDVVQFYAGELLLQIEALLVAADRQTP